MCGPGKSLTHQSVPFSSLRLHAVVVSKYSEPVEFSERRSWSGTCGSGVQGGVGSALAGSELVWSLDSFPCLRS